MRYRDIKSFLETHERVLIPGVLVFGVAVDFITFKSISIRATFTLLGIYAAIAALTILFLNAYETERLSHHRKNINALRVAAPYAIQFTFGALLSASLIFYWYSGAFSVSWPIIGVIAVLMMSNDVLRHYYLNPVVQVGVGYFILFSLFSLILPFAFNSISPWIFLLGGGASLGLMFLFLRLLVRAAPALKTKKRVMENAIFAVFVCMNALYALNVIPPIPLSLRDAGAYHSVVKTDAGYVLSAEREPWVGRFLPGQTIHIRPGDAVYIYSAIFAPLDLRATIAHRWERYDDVRRTWVETIRPTFSITGGRGEGYRGFSVSRNLREGKWRVSVETERGQVIGRVHFRIRSVETTPELETRLK